MQNNETRTSGKITGDNAEEAVVRMMTMDGYNLICRNYAVHNVGELDCVFEKAGEIYVIEVRSRHNNGNFPSSAETVDYRKRIKIIRTTERLISVYRLYDMNINFMVAQVTHNASGMIKKIELIPF